MAGGQAVKQVRNYDATNNPVVFQGTNGAAVTPSDTTVFQGSILYIGGTGNISVRTTLGTDLTFTNVANSFILPVLVNMVYSTGTTATNIVAVR